jgi:hypothetical protein
MNFRGLGTEVMEVVEALMRSVMEVRAREYRFASASSKSKWNIFNCNIYFLLRFVLANAIND